MTALINTDMPPAPEGAADRPTISPTLLHDLRTPLTHIIGYSEMLTEQAQEGGLDGFVQDLRRIHSAGSYLLDLINQNFQSSHSSGAPIPLPSPAAKVSDAPNAPLASEAHVSQVQMASRSARGNILVVDDNEMNRDVLTQRLKRQGHTVTAVNSGQEALETAGTQPIDIILLDIMMPHMDGYEVLNRLKADNALRHIPVIMVSALNEIESVVRCIEMGADDYLCKPFDPTMLKARVGACLEKKHAHDREAKLRQQLTQSYRQLQKLEKQRDNLITVMIHDLRRPLSSVFQGIQTLDTIGNLNDAQRQILTTAIISGETLLTMINDLLNSSELEPAGRV